jgi:superfamily II RNA helicase
MAYRGQVLAFSGNLVVEECYKCHVMFAMPQDLKDRCLRNHNIEFFCPNGHGQVYTGKTEAQKLRERLAEEERKAEALRARARAAEDQRDAAERSKAATKGALTKAKKRAVNGVCPCCQRHFPNVQKHMEAKHPKEFAKANPTNGRKPPVRAKA